MPPPWSHSVSTPASTFLLCRSAPEILEQALGQLRHLDGGVGSLDGGGNDLVLGVAGCPLGCRRGPPVVRVLLDPVGVSLRAQDAGQDHYDDQRGPGPGGGQDAGQQRGVDHRHPRSSAVTAVPIVTGAATGGCRGTCGGAAAPWPDGPQLRGDLQASGAPRGPPPPAVAEGVRANVAVTAESAELW